MDGNYLFGDVYLVFYALIYFLLYMIWSIYTIFSFQILETFQAEIWYFTSAYEMCYNLSIQKISSNF